MLSKYRTELEASGYAQRTVHAKVRAVELAAAHAGVDAVDLTRDDVLAWMGETDRADWTRIKYLSHVSTFAAWAGIDDPTAGVRRPRQPQGVPRPVSEHDLAAMLDVARGRERVWLLLGAFCGLRSFETAKVAAGDLEQAPDGAWLLRVVGKGGQLALLPCPPVVVQALQAQRVKRGRLWPAATAKGVQEAVRRVAARAGVDCSSHQLRHRYGTAVYSAQHDLLMTQQLMRHRSPATTAGYALVADSRRGQVVAGLPGAQVVDETRPGLRLIRGGA